MVDHLKPNTPAWRKRMAVHRHNGLKGHCRMVQVQAQIVANSPTITPEARTIAIRIHGDAAALYELLKVRVDANS